MINTVIRRRVNRISNLEYLFSHRSIGLRTIEGRIGLHVTEIDPSWLIDLDKSQMDPISATGSGQVIFVDNSINPLIL